MTIYNKIAGKRIGRIEALSDGVFAIAMTILVFDLKDPVGNVLRSDGELLTALGGMLPKFLSYFLSFMTLGIFWMGQSTQFHYMDRYDRGLNWTTLFFLMFVSLIPFSTNILSGHITSRLAILLYWFNILALGLLIFVHWHYAWKRGYISVQEGEGDKHLINIAIRKRVIIAQSLYAFGAVLCFINTYLSIAFIIAVQLNYALGLIGGSKRKKAKDS